VFTWFLWRPLGAGLVAGSVVAVSAVFWQARWQFQVRADGLYSRRVPFVPVWRSIAAASEVTDVTADHDAQRLAVDEALAAYTRGAAHAEFAENEKGRLVPGFLGDAVVLDRDPYDGPDAVGDCRVEATVLGGEVVYEAAPSATPGGARADVP